MHALLFWMEYLDNNIAAALHSLVLNWATIFDADPETKELIKKTLEIGHMTYEVQVQLPQVRFLDMWEPAVLAIKREGYSIKCNGQRGVVITEKFQGATAVSLYSLA